MSPDTIPRTVSVSGICSMSASSPRSTRCTRAADVCAPSCSWRPSACTAWSSRSATVSGPGDAHPGKIRHTLAEIIGKAGRRHRVRSYRRQRCRPLGRRPRLEQSCSSGGTRCPGAPLEVATHDLAIRERRGDRNVLYRMGRALDASVIERHRRRLNGRARSDHDRSGHDRRPDARWPSS